MAYNASNNCSPVTSIHICLAGASPTFLNIFSRQSVLLLRLFTVMKASVLSSWVILQRRQYLDYIASNGRMIDELESIWKEAVVAYRGTMPAIA
jgi:hypothetical protein